MQQHTHTNTLTDPTHTHTPTGGAVIPNNALGQYANAAFSGQASGSGGALGASATGISVSIATSGIGASGNIPPGIVAGMTFIKT